MELPFYTPLSEYLKLLLRWSICGDRLNLTIINDLLRAIELQVYTSKMLFRINFDKKWDFAILKSNVPHLS